MIRFKHHWPILVSFFLLIALLLRNPFSVRTLIPNLEPFPDTFHYLTTPNCWLKGAGWKLCREGREGAYPGVPPLYSIYLLPFLAVIPDPRIFYLANVLLCLSSLFLLYLIIKKITPEKTIILLCLLIYATSYVTYWYPTLAMAENLSIPLFLGSVWLLMQPTSPKSAVLMGLLTAGHFGSKYGALGMMMAQAVIYLLKIYKTSTIKSEKIKTAAFFVTSAFLLFLVFGGYKIVDQLLFMLQTISVSGTSVDIAPDATAGAWLSPSYLAKNSQFYLDALLGKTTKVLWDYRPLLPSWLALISLAGVTRSTFDKRFRVFSLILLTLLGSQLITLLPFYSPDSRYSLIMLPILIIGLSWSLFYLEKLLTSLHLVVLFWLSLVVMGSLYLKPQITQLRTTAAINLKYAEQPWWYLATQEMNHFFSSLPVADSPPALITLINPYYVDFFGNRSFEVLPLSDNQDFRNLKQEVWGVDTDRDLLETYGEYLKSGRNLYLTNYGTSAADYFENDYQRIKNKFELKLIQEGCFTQCNIYQVHQKSKNP